METHTYPLRVMQNKLLKFILRLDRFTSTNMIHKETTVLKRKNIGESSVLGFVDKFYVKSEIRKLLFGIITVRRK